jgi:hypothetical protein
MDYRQAFVDRALQLIKGYKGSVPSEIKTIMKELEIEKTPHSLSTEEFNLLQDAAERIDTQTRLNQVQKTIRRSSKPIELSGRTPRPSNGSDRFHLRRSSF